MCIYLSHATPFRIQFCGAFYSYCIDTHNRIHISIYTLAQYSLLFISVASADAMVPFLSVHHSFATTTTTFYSIIAFVCFSHFHLYYSHDAATLLPPARLTLCHCWYFHFRRLTRFPFGLI